MSVLRPISPTKCGMTAPGFISCTSVERWLSATQAVPKPSRSASSTCSKKFSNMTRSFGMYPCTSVWQIEKKMSNSMRGKVGEMRKAFNLTLFLLLAACAVAIPKNEYGLRVVPDRRTYKRLPPTDPDKRLVDLDGD